MFLSACHVANKIPFGQKNKQKDLNNMQLLIWGPKWYEPQVQKLFKIFTFLNWPEQNKVVSTNIIRFEY